MTPQQIIDIIRAFILGPFLVLAFLVGTFVFWKKGGEEYYDQAELMDVLVLSCFSALVGARAGFILVHFNEFGFDVMKWLSWVSYPGYLGIAALACGFGAIIWHANKRKWDAYEVGDFGAIALSISMVVLYVGEFLNGSGFGNPTSWFVGMSFPGVFDKRHPVQLYAMAAYIILFVILWKLERRYRSFIWYRANRRTAQSGFVLSSFLIGYGLIGAVLCLFQQSFLTVYGVNVELVIRILVIFAGLIVLYIRSGRSFIPKKKTPLRQEKNSSILQPEDVTHTTGNTSETQTDAARPESEAGGAEAGN